jgi:hypothetical protein
MMIASNSRLPAASDFDVRPSAVLAIGVAGVRTLPASAVASKQYKEEVTRVFSGLSEAMEAVVRSHASCFSAARPKLRCMSMLSEGASFEVSTAARSVGAEFSCVLPFENAEYLESFNHHDRPVARELIDAASACLDLPGTPDENSRAYDRAYGVIVANVDLLLVISSGRLSQDSDDLEGLVQLAASRGIPIIAIDAGNSRPASLLNLPVYDELSPVTAKDLHAADLPADLVPLVRRILLSPEDSAVLRGLEDLVAEPHRPVALRFEYSLLLKLFRVSRIQAQSSQRSPPHDDRRRNLVDPAVAESSISLIDNQNLMLRLQRFDQLANYYGQLCRSSAAAGFLVIIIIAFLSALAGMIFPSLSGTSIAIQIAVNILVLVDVTLMKRHRWMERWLDYRAIAERLRCLRFLHPLGLGDVHRSSALSRRRQSWIDWYVQRCCFELEPPSGKMSRDIPQIANVLVLKEIEAQLDYHRGAFRRFGRLEQRLFITAYAALAATVAIAAGMEITALFVGSIQSVSWRPLALLALAVFPAATTALNGLRADADLVQLVERSASATVALIRLRRAINGAALNYDRVAAAATKVSLLMGDELSEWRFMLENRRLRRSRSPEWRKR